MEDWDAETQSGGLGVAAPELPEIKLFGRWTSDDVQVNDMSLTVSILIFLYFLSVEVFSVLIIDYFKVSLMNTVL